jgi:diaminopimelate decarboxylase
VASALRSGGFCGTLLLEPGRAVVADAVDLVFTVVAVKTLADGSRCLVCDAGTNFLPGALTAPPRIDALEACGPVTPALVTGPLCLNIDVIHPRAELPEVAPGARLVARSVGAYQQVAATQFGEAPPPVAIRAHATQTVSV